jgi:membrane protein
MVVSEPPKRPGLVGRTKLTLDRVQQRSRVTAFPVAVFRKASDDNASTLAAIVAYYAFFAIFPLLLVLVTVLGLVLKNDNSLRLRVINSALGEFPVIGTQLLGSNGGVGLQGHGLALAIGIIGTFLGATGMSSAFRNACDAIWAVPRQVRTGGPKAYLENLALLVVVGGGLVGTSLVSGYAVGTLDLGWFGRIGGVLLSAGLNVGVFALSFRLATSSSVPFRSLRVGAAIAAVGWTLLQVVGGLVVTHEIANASDVYGTFAIVIGLLTWLYLSAYLTVLSLEVDVVRVRHLWPRAFFDRNRLNAADRRALTGYVEAERRAASQQIDVHYSE